jgi:hypothetical protein
MIQPIVNAEVIELTTLGRSKMTATLNTPKIQQTAIALGFWSAIFASLFTILFVLIAIGTSLIFPIQPWSGIQTYAEHFNWFDMASFIPAFFLAPTMVILVACIHAVTPESKKIFSQIGLAFTVIYATIIPTNYYLQLFVVRLNLQNGTLEGLSIQAQPNLHSTFFALETLGYGFLSLSTLFVSQVFSSGKLEIWIRWLFIASGAVGIFGVLVAPFDQPYLIFAGLGIWSIAFPISTILLSIFFRRIKGN